MSNLVIVAIPDENDRVWKVSSEKVPHLTLLFLGDVDNVANVEQIVQFVEHAASTSLRRFWLPVDRRDELGEDKADVLFFKKGRYDYKAIRDFRAILLKDDNIRTAYDSATQFDGVWQPHLTLGYPATPAKPDDTDRDYGFYDVQFNKIAVWMGDFDGPEFLLKDYWDEYEALESVPMDVAMSDIREGALEHYGVKGMRWGVRKEDLAAVGRAAKSAGGAVGKAAAAAGTFVGDVNFESRAAAEDGRARQAIIAKANPAFKRTDLPALKERHGEYGKMLNRAKKPFSKEARAYRKDAKETYIKRLEESANSMTNISGTRQYTIRERGWELPEAGGALPKSKYYWDVTTRKIEHADEAATFTRLEVVFDDEGWITDLKEVPVEETMAQTIELGAEFLMHAGLLSADDFLEHYGVKGMRWGVRKAETKGEVGSAKRWFDPEGHRLSDDIVKGVVWPMIPPLGLFSGPAQVRLAVGAARGVKAKALDVQEKRFEKQAQSAKSFAAIHNGAGERINNGLEGINKKYSDADLTKDPKKQKAYDDEVLKLMQDAYRESANSITNKANTRHLDVDFVGDGMDVKISAKEGPGTPIRQRVKHADGDDDVFTFHAKFKRDSVGRIIGMEFEDFELPEPPKELAQSAIVIGSDLVLKHYGVKGMRWGVRRNREAPLAVDAMARSRVPHGTKRKTKIETEGGENHPASDDAIKVAKARVKLSKSGAAALSNQELREVANRLQLEQQVKQLTTSGGKKFVSNLLREEGKQTGGQVFRKGAKKARKVAIGI